MVNASSGIHVFFRLYCFQRFRTGVFFFQLYLNESFIDLLFQTEKLCVRTRLSVIRGGIKMEAIVLNEKIITVKSHIS